MRRSYGVVHAIAECEDCDWVAKSYKNAQATASIHARKHGHKVIGNLGISFYYNGREEAKD